MTRTDEFSYDLPDEAVAQEAVEPRDAARLLVARTLEDRSITDLPALLRPGDLVVVNSTRVRAARLRGIKGGTGGAVEVLLLGRRVSGDWTALCRPARRLRPGTRLEFGPITGRVQKGPERGVALLSLEAEGGSVEDLLPAVGSVPLPPYFHGVLDDPERYQTIFAKTVGSAAASTAGLHFTPRLVAALRERGVDLAEIDLQVGLDTFRPIAEETLADHEMHREAYEIPDATAELVERVRAEGGRIVAIGTTVVRALESAASHTGHVAPGPGEASLFITPGYRFRAVDAVLTNFHAPRSTLVVLVAALLGPHWRAVYDTALERGYRFLSFGDAMFVDPVSSP